MVSKWVTPHDTITSGLSPIYWMFLYRILFCGFNPWISTYMTVAPSQVNCSQKWMSAENRSPDLAMFPLWSVVLGATPDQLGIKWCLESTIHHGKNWIVPTFWFGSEVLVIYVGGTHTNFLFCQIDYNVPIDMANNKPISHGACRSSRKQTKLICLHHCWIYLSQVQPVFVPSSLPVSMSG
jgi:hypothetical protein